MNARNRTRRTVHLLFVINTFLYHETSPKEDNSTFTKQNHETRLITHGSKFRIDGILYNGFHDIIALKIAETQRYSKTV